MTELRCRHFVYIHLVPELSKDGTPRDPCDPGLVFYVGKGTRKKGTQRHAETRKRSAFWKQVVARRGGFEPVIVFQTDVESEALQWEQRLIRFIGRRDLGSGPLVNLTSGGEGVSDPSDLRRRQMARSAARFHTGRTRPRETGHKISQALLGRKRSPEQCERISRALRGKKQAPEAVEARAAKTRGRKHTAEQLARITEAFRELKGRRIIDLNTGRVFRSLSEACSAVGVNRGTLGDWLRGRHPSKTSLRFLDSLPGGLPGKP